MDKLSFQSPFLTIVLPKNTAETAMTAIIPLDFGNLLNTSSNNATTINMIPNTGINKKRSPKGQLIKKRKLEVNKNVLMKIKAPNPTIFFLKKPILEK